MTRHLAPPVCVAIVLVCAGPAIAQDARASEAPAHISIVDGSATLERDGQIDSSPASMPLLAGDRIRTQGGRVEVLFRDGSTLYLDANSTLDFQSDAVVRLLEGRIRLAIAGPPRAVDYRVDAPSAWVQITEPGEYRISLLGGERESEVELAVLRGAAELVNEDGRSEIRAGERAFARAGSAPSAPYVFNSAAWDAFDRWAESRRDQRLGASAQYLPEDVRPYAATFDSYGTWRHAPSYGYVWYPRVHSGWRPYYRGRWASLRPYGWTWIAHDPWGWPTHHYGRWGFSAGVWFWIPGRTWGPAWVSWAYSPGYVSWCPLGWNNRPVLQIVNVNTFHGRRYDPWHAWTVVPQRHFRGSYVNVNVLASTRADGRRFGRFVERQSAPAVRYAVPRAAAPIRAAGAVRTGQAVPRGSGGSSRDAARASIRSSRVNPGTSSVSESRGFPAPARAPRTPSAIMQRSPRPDTARPTPGLRQPSDGERGSAPVTVPRGAVRAVPRRDPNATTAPGSRSGTDDWSGDRGVPRQPQYSPPPEYRAQPRYRAQPDARPDTSTPPEYRAPEVRRPESRRSPEYSAPQPRPEYRSAPGVRRAPESRPMPDHARPAPRGGDAPSFRSAPERRAPSGPPPSAAPSRERSPSAAPQSRPRGGEGSQGRARPRG
jgi:hypothetical protein